MTPLRDTLSLLSGIVILALGATYAVMYTDSQTVKQTERANTAETEALTAAADALRKRIDNKIRIIAELRGKCDTREAAIATVPLAPVAAMIPVSTGMKAEPKTVYVYRTKTLPAPTCRKPKTFCNLIGCYDD